MDSSKISRISQHIDSYSFSNKETEDFKRSLAENVGTSSSPTSPQATSQDQDPIFTLIIRLLKESKHTAAKDMLNYYYVSCDASDEALQYFYSNAKQGDPVARVQLGKLSREGKLTKSSQELQVIAEAFASQHELAMLKLEDQADHRENKTSSTGSEMLDDAIDLLNDKDGMESIKQLAKQIDNAAHRPQKGPMSRLTQEEIDSTEVPLTEDQADQLLIDANLNPQVVKDRIKNIQKTKATPTTKPKSKRSKSSAKAKKAKEPSNGR